MDDDDELIAKVLGEHVPARSTVTLRASCILLACLAVGITVYQSADLLAGLAVENEAKIRLGFGCLMGLLVALLATAGYIAWIMTRGRQAQAAAEKKLLARSLKRVRSRNYSAHEEGGPGMSA